MPNNLKSEIVGAAKLFGRLPLSRSNFWRFALEFLAGINPQLVRAMRDAFKLCAFEGISAPFNEPVHINARPTKLNSLFWQPTGSTVAKNNFKKQKAKQKFLANGNFLLFHLFAYIARLLLPGARLEF